MSDMFSLHILYDNDGNLADTRHLTTVIFVSSFHSIVSLKCNFQSGISADFCDELCFLFEVRKSRPFICCSTL
jgi:hypothetical protein